MEIVRYRRKEKGGLNLFHVRSKTMATLIKSLLETGSNTSYIQSHYHHALIAWNVYDNKTIPDPGKNPYYNQETYNIMKQAVSKGKELSTMTGKAWYQFILESVIGEEDNLTPYRVELKHPLHDWSRSWSLSRMEGLSSSSMTFLFRMLHQILPCRERIARIFSKIENSNCRICLSGESDSLLHSLALCSGSRDSFNWMLSGLNKFCDNLTPQNLLLLDIKQSTPLPFNQLPLIWFSAEVMSRIFSYRREEKKCKLYEIRSELEAEINMVRKSKYADMAIILDLMMDQD